VDLLSEMEIMKEIGKHVNVIGLLGCCTGNGELLVLMEFAISGNLRDYLRRKRHQFSMDSPKIQQPEDFSSARDTPSPPESEDAIHFPDLMSFAYQVSRGMEYLSLKKVNPPSRLFSCTNYNSIWRNV